MIKKTGCKQCDEREYSFSKTIKNGKAKYFMVCPNCKKAIRIYPKKMARIMYGKFLDSKVLELTGEPPHLGATLSYCHDKREYNLYVLLNKEYSYLNKNLYLWFEYLFLNDLFEKIKAISVNDVVSVILNYKEPLTQEMCVSIFDELLKTHKA